MCDIAMFNEHDQETFTQPTPCIFQGLPDRIIKQVQLIVTLTIRKQWSGQIFSKTRRARQVSTMNIHLYTCRGCELIIKSGFLRRFHLCSDITEWDHLYNNSKELNLSKNFILMLVNHCIGRSVLRSISKICDLDAHYISMLSVSKATNT